MGGKIGGYGIEVEGTASYDHGSVSTHTTTVDEEVDIRVHFGPIDRGLGETNFNVTPYVYWATNGALVVDYAARAILPSQGGTATWWSSVYGTAQDPAFILPWRLDPEKGFALQEEERRRQTKSISLSPAEPSEGDTVTISALVNNFSLIETEGAVPVSFYLGDPGSGGFLITGLNGESVVTTSGKIPAQGALKASLQWKVPGGLPAFPRIYAVIDPADDMNEIHRENNIGWRVIEKSEFTTGMGESQTINRSGSAAYVTRCYPNPFDGTFTIAYENTLPGAVTLQVYDSRGSLVYSREAEHRSAGMHTMEVNSRHLSPGAYFYRFTSGQFTEVRKILKR